MTAAAQVDFSTGQYLPTAIEFTPLVPREPAACVLLRLGLLQCLDLYSPGLLASELSAITIVPSRSNRAHGAHVRHFLRIGALFDPSATPDAEALQESPFPRLLRAIRAKVSQILADTCSVLPAVTPGFMRQALGNDIQSLPCFVGSYSAWSHPSLWLGATSPHATIAEMFNQSGSSAFASMVVKLHDSSPSPYRFSLVTLGIESGSRAFQTLGAETTGAGVLMEPKSDENIRPVMDFFPIAYGDLLKQFTELRAFVGMNGQQIGVSPQLDAASAAHLLPLPRMLFRS